MKIKLMFIGFILISSMFTSCESETEKKERLISLEKDHIEREKQLIEREKQIALEEAEADRLEAIRVENEIKEKEIYDKYINNSLSTGEAPYNYCFGKNPSCDDSFCSQIKVKTPQNSDVLVIIKKNGKVYRHAYINSNSTYTFEFPNGTYQAFFYYGKGWNPNKYMKETTCGSLNGGFITEEFFSKDSPQNLSNNILTYQLILQQNGNFSTKPSSLNEAF